MSETPRTQSSTPIPPQTRGQEQRTPATAPARGREARPGEPPPGGGGWQVFAATMLVLAGSYQIVVGLTALLRSGYYLVGTNNLVVNVDFTVWGWVHLGLGALAVAAGVGVLSGRDWARLVGIALAGLSAVVNLAFLAAFPFWAVTLIAIDVLVIYALAVHGTQRPTTVP